MIVRRWTYAVQDGNMNECIALLKEGFGELGRNLRIYTSHTGPGATLAFEMEYESLSDYEAAAKEWWADPENAARAKKFGKLVEPERTTEFWSLR